MRNITLSSASMPWLELTFSYRTELVYLIIQSLIRSPVEWTQGKFIWERKRKESKSWKKGILDWAHLGSIGSLLNCQLECAKQNYLKSGKT